MVTSIRKWIFQGAAAGAKAGYTSLKSVPSQAALLIMSYVLGKLVSYTKA